MKSRRLYALLPSLFTVSSIFCGFYAILMATNGADPERFLKAAVAILFAAIFDTMDGRVARMTKTESEFGVQLDSLADVISFGAAPAVLAYQWGLSGLGFFGLLVAFGFAACGALRLARFNVQCAKGKGCSGFFVGMPIPLAALGIVSLVLLHRKLGGGVASHQPLVALFVAALSWLMVSRVPYRTFKKAKASTRTFVILGAVAAAVTAGSVLFSFSHVLFFAWVFWSAYGIAEGSVRLVQKRLSPALYARKHTEDDR
ncbi:MAG: CDP-diacylglycerol--serine O-phosphatidyltransferase [Myxococcales bacterium]|nr:CDP-diacylglycerol--serine O-phosphatidyltransferase [Myxococcales bacterium]